MQVFDPQGGYLRTIGASARGPAELTAPRGVAVDPTGRLLASDTVDDRIELFAPGTNAYAGQWTAVGGTSSRFYRPTGIGIDPAGSVYVADRGYGRLLKLWGDGTWLAEIGGPAARGGAQLSGNGAPAVWPALQQTYVADAGHNRILVFGPEGLLRARWGAGEGNGTAGSGPGSFDHPQALALDAAGEVYVADTGNDRVVKLSATGAVLGAWGRTGGANGSFRSPSGIGIDPAGDVYVTDTDNNRIQVFDANGRWLRGWGNRGTAPGQFSQPSALAIGCAGDVYVADTNNNRVQRFGRRGRRRAAACPPAAGRRPLDVAPVAEREAAAGRPGAGQARAVDERRLPARLQDPRHRDAGPHEPRPPRGARWWPSRAACRRREAATCACGSAPPGCGACARPSGAATRCGRASRWSPWAPRAGARPCSEATS